MLNGIYYSSESGDCYKNSSTSDQCDFESGNELPKGLSIDAQNMIDGKVIWNLGGSEGYANVTNGLVTHWYNYERGTTVYINRPAEWSTTNDSEYHKGVGLIYQSDYGYASHGGSKGRDFCFSEALYKWDTGDWKTNCANNDWLKPNSWYLWTITPASNYFSSVFFVAGAGYLNAMNSSYSYFVWPTVFLKSNVKITDGDGTINTPYTLSVQ